MSTLTGILAVSCVIIWALTLGHESCLHSRKIHMCTDIVSISESFANIHVVPIQLLVISKWVFTEKEVCWVLQQLILVSTLFTVYILFIHHSSDVVCDVCVYHGSLWIVEGVTYEGHLVGAKSSFVSCVQLMMGMNQAYSIYKRITYAKTIPTFRA